MKLPTPVIPYRWTALDATAAQLADIIELWCTPYRIRARDLDRGERGLLLGLPGLAGGGFGASDIDFGFEVGERISFSLGLSIDPPSVARFFRPGYEWVDVPEEVELEGKTIQGVMEACHDLDPVRFGHFDPAVVASTFAARFAATWSDRLPRSPMHLPAVSLNPYNYPWGDLAMLHFEYWENTDLRAALINQRADFEEGAGLLDALKGLGVIGLHMLKGDPWTGIWGDLWPWTVPAVEGEHRLEKVLARVPRRGVPIAALPTLPDARGEAPRAGRTVAVVSMPPPRIELDGFGRQVLTPLQDPVPLLPGGRKMGGSQLRFVITIPYPAVKTRIEILQHDRVVARDLHDGGEFLVPGRHVWSWDGFDSNGVFDSAVLKSAPMMARVTVTDAKGRTSVGTSPFAAAADKYRWVETRIDRETKSIDVTCYQQFKSPSEMKMLELDLPVDVLTDVVDSGMAWMSEAAGSSGGAMGSMLTQAANVLPGASDLLSQLIEELRKLLGLGGGGDGGSGVDELIPHAGAVAGMFNTDRIEVGSKLGPLLQGGADLEPEIFDRFAASILEGIARHWSREIVVDGETWSLRVSGQTRGYDAQVNYLSSAGGLLGTVRGDEAHRSFNLAIVEGLPVYNIYREGKLLPQSHVDRGWVTDRWARFASTGAHELGHQVLIERKDWLFSMTHKGTSTIGQTSLPDAPFHVESIDGQANWEIDVMYYYNRDSVRPPENWQARFKAAEEDACVLVSMGKVAFGG